jgi:hypothetical protein
MRGSYTTLGVFLNEAKERSRFPLDVISHHGTWNGRIGATCGILLGGEIDDPLQVVQVVAELVAVIR